MRFHAPPQEVDRRLALGQLELPDLPVDAGGARTLRGGAQAVDLQVDLGQAQAVLKRAAGDPRQDLPLRHLVAGADVELRQPAALLEVQLLQPDRLHARHPLDLDGQVAPLHRIGGRRCAGAQLRQLRRQLQVVGLRTASREHGEERYAERSERPAHPHDVSSAAGSTWCSMPSAIAYTRSA